VRIKKYLRFLMLLLLIMIACILPFPIKLYHRDKLPAYEIEQFDKKGKDENAAAEINRY